MTKEHLCKEILDSIKECLWLKWLPTQQEVEQKQLLANTPQPDHLAEFAAMNCSTYEKFTAMNQDSHEEMMALARDTHQLALAAATILEGKEKMSHSTNLAMFWQLLMQEVQVLTMSRRSPSNYLPWGI